MASIRQKLLCLLGVFVGAPAVCSGQSLPAACREAIIDTTSLLAGPEFYGAAVNRLQTAVSASLSQVGWGSPADSGRQRLMKIVDSVAPSSPELTAWVLAEVIVDEYHYGGFESWLAAMVFRAHDLPPGPMLRRLTDGSGPGRVALGLQALSPGLNQSEERTVFALACRAGWALEATTADTAMTRLWLESEVPALWVGQNLGILHEAHRLLGDAIERSFAPLVEVFSRSGFHPFE